MTCALSAVSISAFASPALSNNQQEAVIDSGVKLPANVIVDDKTTDFLHNMDMTKGINYNSDRIDAKNLTVTLANKSLKDVTSAVMPNVSVEARYFSPKLGMKVKSDEIYTINNNSRVDFKDTLGLDDKAAPELKVKYNSFELDYFHLHSSGSKNLASEPVKFNNTVFNTNVNTKLDFDYLFIKKTNRLLHTNFVKLDYDYGLMGFHFNGKLNDSKNNESKNFVAGLPVVGFSVQTSIDKVHNNLDFYATISGLPAGGYGHFYDFETGLKYSIGNNLTTSIGYRAVDLKVNHDDDDVNLSMNGPFLGIAYNF